MNNSAKLTVEELEAKLLESNADLDPQFQSAKKDLGYALEWAIDKKELLSKPDYSLYTDLASREFIKWMFDNYAHGDHSWITFITAVAKHKGNYQAFTESRHYA